VFWRGKEVVMEKVLNKVKEGDCAIVKWKKGQAQGSGPPLPELEEGTRGFGTVAFFEGDGRELGDVVRRVKGARDVGIFVTRERTEFVPEWVDWYVVVGEDYRWGFKNVAVKEWAGGNGEIWRVDAVAVKGGESLG
jgi:hypothetical protein